MVPGLNACIWRQVHNAKKVPGLVHYVQSLLANEPCDNVMNVTISDSKFWHITTVKQWTSILIWSGCYHLARGHTHVGIS